MKITNKNDVGIKGELLELGMINVKLIMIISHDFCYKIT